MKEKNALFLGLILVLSISMYFVWPAAADLVGTGTWLEPAFRGTDAFYATDVTAYRELTVAKLAVTVDKDGAPPTPQVNITAISVVFDWGGNYTIVPTTGYTLNNTVTQAAFTVPFTVPSTSVASNLFLHTYTIYVKYNTTMGAGTFPTVTRDAFAVYSTSQANAQALNQQVDAYPTTFSPAFVSPEAGIFWEKAKNAADMADKYYQAGAFVDAESTYQAAVNLFEEAFAAEAAYSQDYRASQTSYNNALANAANKGADAAMVEADARAVEANATMVEADAAMRQADAALSNAYGWLFFGIGWTLIGLGAIIYGLRKPKPPV